MTARQNKIFAAIPVCEVFADIGCDHGYLAKAALDNKKCKKAIVSDISAKCLKKAEKLLEKEIFDGKAQSVLSDGFKSLPHADVALIAGLGGEEIVKILAEAPVLPEKLILQPMKNCDKVRAKAVKLGYKIIRDIVFFAGGKFYDLISLEKGEDVLTEDELQFGRTNIIEKPEDFRKKMLSEVGKLEKYIASGKLKGEKLAEMIKKAEKYKKLC